MNQTGANYGSISFTCLFILKMIASKLLSFWEWLLYIHVIYNNILYLILFMSWRRRAYCTVRDDASRITSSRLVRY